jgi:hypothetical protein
LTEFKGEWYDDMNSEGILKYQSGSEYEGQLKNNKRHGIGLYTYPTQEELNQAVANHENMKIDKEDYDRISFFWRMGRGCQG